MNNYSYTDEFDEHGKHIARTFCGDEKHPKSWREEYDDDDNIIACIHGGDETGPSSWRNEYNENGTLMMVRQTRFVDVFVNDPTRARWRHNPRVHVARIHGGDEFNPFSWRLRDDGSNGVVYGGDPSNPLSYASVRELLSLTHIQGGDEKHPKSWREEYNANGECIAHIRSGNPADIFSWKDNFDEAGKHVSRIWGGNELDPRNWHAGDVISWWREKYSQKQEGPSLIFDQKDRVFRVDDDGRRDDYPSPPNVYSAALAGLLTPIETALFMGRSLTKFLESGWAGLMSEVNRDVVSIELAHASSKHLVAACAAYSARTHSPFPVPSSQLLQSDPPTWWEEFNENEEWQKFLIMREVLPAIDSQRGQFSTEEITEEFLGVLRQTNEHGTIVAHIQNGGEINPNSRRDEYDEDGNLVAQIFGGDESNWRSWRRADLIEEEGVADGTVV